MKYFCLSIGLLFISCTGYKILNSNYDKTVDFSSYKTFAWLPQTDTSNNQYDNEPFRNCIVKDFSKQLTKKGYILSVDTPDVLLELKIMNFKQLKRETYRYSSADSPNDIYHDQNPSVAQRRIYYNYPLPQNYDYKTTSTFNYTTYTDATQSVYYMQNSITINVIDKQKKKLIWTATSEADLYDTDGLPFNPEPIIKELIKKYPLKQKKHS